LCDPHPPGAFLISDSSVVVINWNNMNDMNDPILQSASRIANSGGGCLDFVAGDVFGGVFIIFGQRPHDFVNYGRPVLLQSAGLIGPEWVRGTSERIRQ
jgi:hypothetical protein